MHLLNLLLQLVDLTLQQIVAHIHCRDCLDHRLMIKLVLDLNIAHTSDMVFQNVSIFSDDILYSLH